MAERPSPRLDIQLPCSIAIDGEAPTRAVSVNLSETGVLVRAGRIVRRGTMVSLEFPEFKAGGEVIWTRNAGPDGLLIGVKFQSLGWRDRRKVRELVSLAED